MSLGSKITVIILVTMTLYGFYTVYNINDEYCHLLVDVQDEAQPMAMRLVTLGSVLLDDESTSYHTAVTGSDGFADFKNVPEGQYLAQVLGGHPCNRIINLENRINTLRVWLTNADRDCLVRLNGELISN